MQNKLHVIHQHLFACNSKAACSLLVCVYLTVKWMKTSRNFSSFPFFLACSLGIRLLQLTSRCEVTEKSFIFMCVSLKMQWLQSTHLFCLLQLNQRHRLPLFFCSVHLSYYRSVGAFWYASCVQCQQKKAHIFFSAILDEEEEKRNRMKYTSTHTNCATLSPAKKVK